MFRSTTPTRAAPKQGAGSSRVSGGASGPFAGPRASAATPRQLHGYRKPFGGGLGVDKSSCARDKTPPRSARDKTPPSYPRDKSTPTVYPRERTPPKVVTPRQHGRKSSDFASAPSSAAPTGGGPAPRCSQTPRTSSRSCGGGGGPVPGCGGYSPRGNGVHSPRNNVGGGPHTPRGGATSRDGNCTPRGATPRGSRPAVKQLPSSAAAPSGSTALRSSSARDVRRAGCGRNAVDPTVGAGAGFANCPGRVAPGDLPPPASPDECFAAIAAATKTEPPKVSPRRRDVASSSVSGQQRSAPGSVGSGSVSVTMAHKFAPPCRGAAADMERRASMPARVTPRRSSHEAPLPDSASAPSSSVHHVRSGGKRSSCRGSSLGTSAVEMEIARSFAAAAAADMFNGHERASGVVGRASGDSPMSSASQSDSDSLVDAPLWQRIASKLEPPLQGHSVLSWDAAIAIDDERSLEDVGVELEVDESLNGGTSRVDHFTSSSPAGSARCDSGSGAAALGSEAGNGCQVFDMSDSPCFSPTQEHLLEHGDNIVAAKANGVSSTDVAGALSSLAVARGKRGADRNVAALLQQVLKENAELRNAFDAAQERLVALEDEQQRFLGEGVFDLVNAAHSEAGDRAGRVAEGDALASTEEKLDNVDEIFATDTLLMIEPA